MNYSDISKKREEDVIPELENEEPCEACQIHYPDEEPMTTTEAQITETESTEEVFGVVTGCAKLNVREEPNLDAKVVTVIKKGTTLEIDMENSDTEWLCVCTASGVEGFCMAEYVEIKD